MSTYLLIHSNASATYNSSKLCVYVSSIRSTFFSVLRLLVLGSLVSATAVISITAWATRRRLLMAGIVNNEWHRSVSPLYFLKYIFCKIFYIIYFAKWTASLLVIISITHKHNNGLNQHPSNQARKNHPRTARRTVSPHFVIRSAPTRQNRTQAQNARCVHGHHDIESLQPSRKSMDRGRCDNVR